VAAEATVPAVDIVQDVPEADIVREEALSAAADTVREAVLLEAAPLAGVAGDHRTVPVGRIRFGRDRGEVSEDRSPLDRDRHGEAFAATGVSAAEPRCS
jgi:hypothetical protein